jgi:hypothetical protein
VRGELRQVAYQGFLHLGRLHRRLQHGLVVFELLDGILDALPLAGGDRIIRPWQEGAAAVHRADLEAASRLALDADGAVDGTRRQVREQDDVIAGLEPYLAHARDLSARWKHRHGIDARSPLDVGGVHLGDARQYR